MTAATSTPLSLYNLPSKEALVAEFKGKKLDALRTPALIVDRSIFKANSERTPAEAYKRGLKFRAHVKTHKTIEGVRLQVEAAGGVGSVICSTMPELWQIVNSGLVEEGLVNDLLLSLPISADKIADVDAAQKKVGDKAVIRLIIDHPAQIEALAAYSAKGRSDAWSLFVKVDGGGRRAGVPPRSEQMKALIQSILAHPAVQIHGFYSHFGQSYASQSLDKATEYYQGEIACVNSAAQLARELGATGKWVLSVGATPTAHAATQNGDKPNEGLEGELEIHAGCYCMCDLQQFATSLVPSANLALTVLGRVVSLYDHRSEALCDIGAIAVSKDTGPFAGFGHIVSPAHATGWSLGRISQEHGSLVHRPDVEVQPLQVGDLLRVVPQHACLVCAGHPWIYVIEDGGDEVVDVWVTWKGW